MVQKNPQCLLTGDFSLRRVCRNPRKTDLYDYYEIAEFRPIMQLTIEGGSSTYVLF